VTLAYALAVLFLLLALGAVLQWIANRTYARYAVVRAAPAVTAGALARSLLDDAELLHVSVLEAGAALDDRYEPDQKTLYLSDLAAGSVAAVAVTAHEVGHALQHAEGHWSLRLRGRVQPASVGGALLALAALALGWWLQDPAVVLGGIWGYVGATGLMLLALPVELDANRRALRLLDAGGVASSAAARRAVQRVLLAALLTYVGAAALPLMHGWLALWSRRGAQAR